MKGSRERLKIYDSVNRAVSLDELGDIIESLADDQGMIQGRERKFNADFMAFHCRNFQLVKKSILTREFGIRQQAIMILISKTERTR